VVLGPAACKQSRIPLRLVTVPVGCPILRNHHFDLPWAGTEGGVIAEKLVKVLPS
jgi:hypothetical protein